MKKDFVILAAAGIMGYVGIRTSNRYWKSNLGLVVCVTVGALLGAGMGYLAAESIEQRENTSK